MRLLLPGLAGLTLSACAAVVPASTADSSSAYRPPTALDARIAAALQRPSIAGLGIAVIRNGETVWTGYYGEQAPGVPVNASTMFNTASVAKTIIAETVLRLADQGKLSLDDPVEDYYRHPDLAEDPRYELLTPRVILSHQTALLNWPYLYDDRKLAFTEDPAQGKVSYSGAAIEMLANYLEARFGKTYPELVDEVLFEPLEVTDVSVRRTAALEGRVPYPRSEDGSDHAPFTAYKDGPEIKAGKWSAADNLFASVEGYAGFLEALLNDEKLSPEMRAQRQSLHSTSNSLPGYVCIAAPPDCPDPIGYGIGWQLFGEPGRMVINHGGNDFGEHAQVYFAPETGDGLVLFINGGNAWVSALEIMEVVEPGLLMAKHYRALLTQMQAEKAQDAKEADQP